MRARIAIGALGLLADVYGALLLLERGWTNLVDTALWLAGGVVAHDFLLAPLTLGLCALAAPFVMPRLRAVGAAALIVVGSVTVVAIPVLGRFGARPDNPTLLDRHYGWGWVGFVVLVGLVCGGWLLWERLRDQRTPTPQQHDG